MSKEHNDQQLEPKSDSQWDSKALLQKRLIWQHLAQKKIKKVLRKKLWSNKEHR